MKRNIRNSNRIKSALFGVATGDALGVPVEFKSRETIKKNPVTDMAGYGTYNLPPGTWSDDSTMTFCLAEAMTHQFDLNLIAQNFLKWIDESYWTPRGKVFDVGNTTSLSVDKIRAGVQPELAGGADESFNGNGSLMRILPLVFYISGKPVSERFEITKQVSSITHRHIRSVIACFYYLEFARLILEGIEKFEAYKKLQKEIPEYLKSLSVKHEEVELFDRLLNNKIYKLPENEIHSTGYVLHTLEASFWCLLTTDNYKDAVLKAVNLGSDSDTTGSVTGGLAGILYGFKSIPESWTDQIVRKEDIEDLAKRLAKKLG